MISELEEQKAKSEESEELTRKIRVKRDKPRFSASQDGLDSNGGKSAFCSAEKSTTFTRGERVLQPVIVWVFSDLFSDYSLTP